MMSQQSTALCVDAPCTALLIFIMVQSVIFDIDGTIIDSGDMHIEAWKRAFERFDKEVSYERIRPQIGKGADDIFTGVFL